MSNLNFVWKVKRNYVGAFSENVNGLLKVMTH